MSATRPNRPPSTKTAEVFDLDVLQAEADLAPFRFRLDEQDQELPHAGMLTGEQALAMSEGSARDVLTEIAGDLGPRLMKLPSHALEALLKRWLAHAGMSQGE